MKKLIVGGALAAALAMPAGAVAKPNNADKRAAQKTCKDLRKTAGKKAFAEMFGGKKGLAFCFNKEARENERERKQAAKQAPKNAAKECKAERDANRQAFNERYRNLGACVSERAKQNRREQAAEDRQEDRDQVNAAKKCKAARSADADAFAAKYGSKRNAFGKCVSQTARGGGENAPQAQG